MSSYYDGGDIDLDDEIVLDSNGERITEDRAAEMAEDAITKVRGRPSLAGSGTSPEVKARVPDQLRQRLMDQAEAEHRQPSTLIREALEQYLFDRRAS
jgi:hypothetical protein